MAIYGLTNTNEDGEWDGSWHVTGFSNVIYVTGGERGGWSFVVTDDIPAGSTITGAWFSAHTLGVSGSSAVTICVEDVDPATQTIFSASHAVPGTTASAIGSATTPTITWSAGGVGYFGQGEANETSLITAIQALVDAYGGLSAGDRINIYVIPASGSGFVGFHDFSSGEFPPDLEITWTEGGPAAPDVTDVDTDETITSDQTNVVITGTGFDTATVEIRQGAVEVGQSIDSQTATAIQLDVVFETAGADLKHGAASLAVINQDAQEDEIAITIEPPSGQLYVDIGTPDPTAANRITAVPDIESGDQLQARGVGGGAAPTGLTLNADATFEFSAGSTAADFDVRVWDVGDATWGAFATQSVGEVEVQPADIAQAQALEAPALTQTHVVTPSDIVQAEALEAPAITQEHQIEPAAIDQAQELDGPALTQDHQLTAGDIAQQQALESPTIEQVHTLAVADLVQAQSLDAVALVIEGTVNPQAIAQVQQFAAVVITQDHQILVADLTQLQELESPGTSIEHSVTVADLVQAQSVEPVTLIVTGTLVLLDLAQLQALEAAGMTQEHLIEVQEIAQLQVLGAPSTAAAGYLVVSSIRVLPALTADVQLIPALRATVRLRPQ